MSGSAPWTVVIGGRNYACWIASTRPDGRPDEDDEMILELLTADLDPVLFISHFATRGELKLATQATDIPAEVVEWAVAAARRQWPDAQFPGPVHG